MHAPGDMPSHKHLLYHSEKNQVMLTRISFLYTNDADLQLQDRGRLGWRSFDEGFLSRCVLHPRFQPLTLTRRNVRFILGVFIFCSLGIS